MRVGDRVVVRVLAIPDRIFNAKLTYIGPSVDPNTRRVAVRAEVENPDGVLKPEMFANFSIFIGGESVAPAVPQEAVVYEGDKARVWVVEAGDKIASREVQTGRMTEGKVEIVRGLKSGEKVVTSGTLFIDRAVKRSMERVAN
jgi:cobalt-zinc-cadmium efflux system membrane fusion protein